MRDEEEDDAQGEPGLDFLVEGPDGRWVMPPGAGERPLTFSLRARRPG